MGCHPSHWRTHIFQRGRSTTNQILIIHHHPSSSIIILDQQFTSSTNQPDTWFGDVKEISHANGWMTPNPFARPRGLKPLNSEIDKTVVSMGWTMMNLGIRRTFFFQNAVAGFRDASKQKLGWPKRFFFVFEVETTQIIDNENIYYIISRNGPQPELSRLNPPKHVFT